MIITVDLETYYSRDYSLTKMSEMEYILSPQFETIGAAIKIGHGTCTWHVGQADVARALAQIDWSRAALLSHNTRFDGAILAWHYGIRPALYLDTLSMARAMTHAVAKRSSLAAVAKYLGLPQKGDEVVRAIGMRLRDFFPQSLARYGDYCRNDTELCRAIFDRMAPRFPAEELRVIDQTCRMYIEPQLELRQDVLAAHLERVRAEKQRVMAEVPTVDKVVFASNLQFAALLTSHGVDVPMKPSPADPDKQIPALARGDRGFQELLADDTQPLLVQALLAARVQTKSTIEETRTEKMLAFSRVRWGDARSHLPVPLRYFGAHTGRFSGDGGFNMQNLRRDSDIRKAIVAKPGHVIVARDASQIEARMVAWLAHETGLVQDFYDGVDIYSKFASTVFSRPITRADKIERFVGKTCILGLGYGMGADRFRHTLFIGQGSTRVTIDDVEASRIVSVYRNAYSRIPILWHEASAVLGIMISQRSSNTNVVKKTLGLTSMRAIRPGYDALWLPNNTCIAYPNIRREANKEGRGSEIVYDSPLGTQRLFGGKVVENVAQALARIVITDIMRRIWDQRKLHACLQVHDSLAYVVPESDAAEFDTYLETQFAIRPAWAPGLPLASEGGYGHSLAEAESK